MTTLLETKPASAPRSSRDSAAALHATVIAGNYCIGCGVCAAPTGSPFTVNLHAAGFYEAQWKSPALANARPNQTDSDIDYEAMCPFGDGGPDEDEIAAELYPSAQWHPQIGRHRDCYAGWVDEGNFRAAGSSGGFAKWLLVELLERDEIDYVIQVFRRDTQRTGDPLYSFGITGTSHGVKLGSKSTYYPIQMADMLRLIRTAPARFAVTGVPCFIKALRLLGRQEPVFAERIRFMIGIVCGHLKSTEYAEMLGWQLGVPPAELGGIDFRHKIPGALANEKGVTAWARGDEDTPLGPRKVQELFGTNYGEGMFKYRACDFCDDVVAETADVSVGDAWLPRYLGEGANILVVRHPLLRRIVREGRAGGRLQLDVVSADEVAESQNAGLRHRREGLSYRLWLQQERGEWAPRKRVEADPYATCGPTKRMLEARIRLVEASPAAFRAAKEAGDFSIFQERMMPAVGQYYRLRDRLARKVGDRLWRSINALRQWWRGWTVGRVARPDKVLQPVQVASQRRSKFSG